MADKMLKIELKKSLIGRGAKQIATAEALGLKKPGDVTAVSYTHLWTKRWQSCSTPRRPLVSPF